MRLLMALACLMVIGFSTSVTARDLTDEEKAIIAASVKKELKDPYSADFIWLPLRPGAYYCGLVNAKNGYGAYVGFTPYRTAVVLSSDYQKLIDAYGTVFGSFDRMDYVYVMCKDAGYKLE